MNIALIGYGKMGRAIEQQAILRGHNIVARIDINSPQTFNSPEFLSADVAIEFTSPNAAFQNCKEALSRSIPVVCGSTGWLSHLPEIKRICAEQDASFFYSSNYSLGMNIFMMLNRYLADLMKHFPQYTPSLQETHHIHKLDHPSGSAVTLAQQLISSYGKLSGWEAKINDATPQSPSLLHITSYRQGEVPGIHTINWESDNDVISITHNAKSRTGFALGAVIAAEWLIGKKGYFEMDQLMHDILK